MNGVSSLFCSGAGITKRWLRSWHMSDPSTVSVSSSFFWRTSSPRTERTVGGFPSAHRFPPQTCPPRRRRWPPARQRGGPAGRPSRSPSHAPAASAQVGWVGMCGHRAAVAICCWAYHSELSECVRDSCINFSLSAYQRSSLHFP